LRRALARDHAVAASTDAIEAILRRFEAWSWLHVEEDKAVLLANRAPEVPAGSAERLAALRVATWQ
jgi:hypothetical protein